MLCTGHPDLYLWHVQSQRNILQYAVHYRGQQSIPGPQEAMVKQCKTQSNLNMAISHTRNAITDCFEARVLL